MLSEKIFAHPRLICCLHNDMMADVVTLNPVGASIMSRFTLIQVNRLVLVLLASLLLSPASIGLAQSDAGVSIKILGIAQDAGYPQAGCKKECCKPAWQDPSLRRYASCIAIVDHKTQQRWILDCTPDFREQLNLLTSATPFPDEKKQLDGILLTHAHIGHYAGLMHLGREAMGAGAVPVYAMPRMARFLETNGPWSQLVKLKNIDIQPLEDSQPIQLNDRITVTPVTVPHRDEFSETVGFLVEGPRKRMLYLPDIDKWSKWDQSIEKWVQKVDYAFLDGTFFSNGEIPGRDMSLIPHPFVEESVRQFSALERSDREKIHFIHLNHTNPAIQKESEERVQLKRAGLNIVGQGETFRL